MSDFNYFDHENQPGRAPADAKVKNVATQLLMPDGTWGDGAWGNVTPIDPDMAAGYARDWINDDADMPEDLADLVTE